MYDYDIETTAQPYQWERPEEPRPKKLCQVRSNVKVLLSVFFDCNGVVQHEFFPQDRTVTKMYILPWRYVQIARNILDFAPL